ncbi:SIS domain-containing protein [Ideonella sp. B7]|uniref:SIS domain-containing protein n=1 Tax=Ideonella benzenivorans TaxID=2831643 RepID=UPI001CEC3456|nr:SIS domain-containing protein [Ideonella benzenivorans]MCA6215040.1 SIS domain-containing protein [Ideonella benzenivorans]
MALLTEPLQFVVPVASAAPAPAAPVSGFLRAWQAQRQVFDALLGLQAPLEQAAARLANCLGAGGKLLWCGQGGSEATAHRLAALMSGLAQGDGRPLAALALSGEDTSRLARQVQALGRPGDALVLLSAGAPPAALLDTVRAAADTAMMVVAVLGPASEELAEECHLALCLPEAARARREEAELFLGHCLCELVREQLAGA